MLPQPVEHSDFAADPDSNNQDWDILSTFRWDPSLGCRMATQLCNRNEKDIYKSVDEDHVSEFYLLPYHRDRIATAAVAFRRPLPENFREEAGLSKFEELLQREVARKIHEDRDAGEAPSCLRIRVCLSIDAKLSITVGPLQSSPTYCPYPTKSLFQTLPLTYRVFIAPEPSKTSLHTVHKTTYRDHYNHLRNMLPSWATDPNQNDGLDAEILLTSEDGEIIEGSITTPYFKYTALHSMGRAGQYFASLRTPRAEAGGNLGTTRRWALEREWCEEAIIMKKDLCVGDTLFLSNGVRGWGRGRLEAWRDHQHDCNGTL